MSEAQLAAYLAKGKRTVMVKARKAGRAAYQESVQRALAEHTDRTLRAGAGEIQPMFELQLLQAVLAPTFKHRPIEGRKFELDAAWPARKIGFEVQGHVHRIKHQFLRDMVRHNTLTEAGWTLYYVSGDMVRDGRALELARRILK